jgi:hypothetical protein
MRKYFALFLLLFAGCEPVGERQYSPIQPRKRGDMLVLVMDTSGSMAEKMFQGDAPAYNFSLRACEKFFRDRMGPDDRIVISQLSANNRPLLWEGSPRSLKRRFKDAKALQEHIAKHSDPCGSRAYAAIADTLDYVCNLPATCDADSRVCILVLSDMLDNSPTQDEDRRRMVDALQRITQRNCGIGFYWVDQSQLSECRQCLVDAGIPEPVIECRIVDDPELPDFQR